MDDNAFVAYLAQLTSNTTNARTLGNYDAGVFARLRDSQSLALPQPHNVQEYKAKIGPEFRIHDNFDTYPMITGFTDQGEVTLSATSPGQYKLSSGNTYSGNMLQIKKQAFKREIKNINMSLFSKGLNFDEFYVENVSNQPMTREHVKYLLERGSIVPLSGQSGIYLPHFATEFFNVFSFEHEGRFHSSVFPSHGGYVEPEEMVDHIVTNPVKEYTGVNVKHILSFGSGKSASYKAYDDHTYSNVGRNRIAKEIVFGSAPIPALLLAASLTFDTWRDKGIVHPDDTEMDYEAGLHISTSLMPEETNIPNWEKKAKIMTEYLKHAGIIHSILGRSKERWKSTSIFLGVPRDRYEGRDDFRFDAGYNRFEMRFMGAHSDVGYLANNVIMASKMITDGTKYIQKVESETARTLRTSVWNSDVKFSGQASQIEEHVFKPLHDPASPGYDTMNQWFIKFMNDIGITDPFDQQFVKNMNAKCRRPRGI